MALQSMTLDSSTAKPSAFLSDVKSLNSPTKPSTKGKHKEETWQLGWWDFVPLVERKRSPIQWTTSSTILTAHAQEPRVIGICFPSSKQFTLPPPPPLSSTGSPQLYGPPSIIVSSAQDTWVFAYFQGNIDASQSVGCLWQREAQIDGWRVKEWWTFERGAGVVQARWLNPGREWVVSESNTPARLPHIGPVLPLLHPVLLVVTENHLCNAYYIHPQNETTKMASGSLCRPCVSRDGGIRSPGERVDGARGLGRCTHAAIGFTYDESSIVIATHSMYTPITSHDHFDLGSDSSDPLAALSIPSVPTEQPAISGWESWRDDSTIELCEIKLSVEGFSLVLSTTPQIPIRMYPPPKRTLVDLIFIPRLPQNPPSVPSTPTPKHRLVTPTSSPALSHLPTPHSPEKGHQRPPVRGSPTKSGTEKPRPKRSGFFTLLCTSLDFGDYSSPPNSEITQFIIASERAMTNEPSRQSWLHRRERSSRIDHGVVVNMTPVQPTTLPQHVGTLVSVIHTQGPVIRKKEGKHMSVGKFYVLRADLQIDENWEATNIVCPVGSNPPLSIAVSPNSALIAAAAMSTAFETRTSVHPHPSRTFPQEQHLLSSTVRWWSAVLSTSMQKRTSPNDIAHFLSMPGTLQQHVDVITLSLQELDGSASAQSTVELVGVTADVFKLRSARAKTEVERESLLKQFQVGHEICSMVACASAWEQCMDEGNEYDLDEIWHLVGLCGYFIDTASGVLKAYVILDNVRKEERNVPLGTTTGSNAMVPRVTVDGVERNKDVIIYGSDHATSFSSSCEMLHLLHPFALSQLHAVLHHVKRFHAMLNKLFPRNQNASTARDMLIDNIETSGISLDALDNALTELRDDVRKFADRSPDLTRRSLAALQALPGHLPLQDRIVSRLMQGDVIDKARLFLQSNDLVDGLLGMTLNLTSQKQRRDVVCMSFLSKNKQPMSCLRCDGETDLNTHVPPRVSCSQRWYAWERSWLSHCVCGGLWNLNPVAQF